MGKKKLMGQTTVFLKKKKKKSEIRTPEMMPKQIKYFSLQLDLIYVHWRLGGYIKKTQKGKDQFDQFGTICLTEKQLVNGEKASYRELFALLLRKCPVQISLQHPSPQASISSQSSRLILAVAPPTYS